VAGIAVFALAGLGCSALLPLTISFGEGDLTAMAAAMAGGVIAFYQLGYGIAAFGVGPLTDSGVSLSRIFGFTAVVAGAMAVLTFFVTRRQTRAEPAAGPDPSLRLVPGAGDQRGGSSR
jgi:predicted MFS family arabinose efflux permease